MLIGFKNNLIYIYWQSSRILNSHIGDDDDNDDDDWCFTATFVHMVG
jgi:hypothetical protein